MIFSRIGKLLLPLHQRIFSQAVPLTDLLKKNQTLHWSKECQRAFGDLKKVIIEELVLVLSDYTKSFEV